jgi:hypothetical protein
MDDFNDIRGFAGNDGMPGMAIDIDPGQSAYVRKARKEFKSELDRDFDLAGGEVNLTENDTSTAVDILEKINPMIHYMNPAAATAGYIATKLSRDAANPGAVVVLNRTHIERAYNTFARHPINIKISPYDIIRYALGFSGSASAKLPISTQEEPRV